MDFDFTDTKYFKGEQMSAKFGVPLKESSQLETEGKVGAQPRTLRREARGGGEWGDRNPLACFVCMFL